MNHFLQQYKCHGGLRATTSAVSRALLSCAFVACAVILSAAILMSAGCQSDSTGDVKDSDVIKPTKQAKEGPVSLSIELSNDKVLTTDHVNIRIELKAPKGVTVHLDDYDQTLRDSDVWYDLRLIGQHKKPAVPFDADTLLWSSEYEVEFLLAQEYELPGASATFVDIRDQAGQADQADQAGQADNNDQADQDDKDSTSGDVPKSQAISTDSLLLQVEHPADVAELTEQDLRKIETLPPIELPARWSRWWILGPMVAVAVAAGLALLIYLGSLIFPPMAKLWLALKRLAHIDDPGQAPPPPPAHEWAYAQIDRLMAEDLLRKGRVQRFYYRISDIVRGYVERRFDVSAPEMTTEEFLAVAAKDKRFEHDQQASLSEFLAACDTVKYAGQIPQIDQGDVVTEAAKQFVDHTRKLDDTASHELAASDPIDANMEATLR